MWHYICDNTICDFLHNVSMAVVLPLSTVFLVSVSDVGK